MVNTPELITTDILVIGGGSSGLWTAKGAKEQNPSADASAQTVPNYSLSYIRINTFKFNHNAII